MTGWGSRLVGLIAVAALLGSAPAQRHPDPFNQLEIDQLRDAAWDPVQRLKLYVAFARARLQTLDQARNDPKVTDKAQQIHDRLQEFLDVYDELNENIDTYVDRKWDLRRALKPVIESDTEFQARLRAIQDSADANRQQTGAYELLLSNALETLDQSAQEHRQLLKEQEQAWKHKKADRSSAAQD